MHIGIFLSSLGFIRGGLETIAAQFARSLADRGHRVTCVSGTWPGRPLPPDLATLPVTWLRVPCLPPDLPRWPGAFRRGQAMRLKAQSLSFAAACRWQRPVQRLLETADCTLSLLEIETVYLSRWRAKQQQGHVSYFPGGIDWRWLRRDCSTVRVAISRTLAEAYSHTPDFRLDGVVTPGIDGRWLEAPYEVRSQADTLLFIGRLEANKGVWELLQIFQALAARFPRLRLHLAGDGSLRPALQAWLTLAGLTTRVHFLGAVPAAQIQQELQRADLFLFPSRYESFGVAVVEAQAVGVPVVCSDLPIMEEAAGGAARLLPPGDVDQWVEAVRELIPNRPARARLSQAGRQHARRFTWAQTVQKLESYLALARSRATKRPLL